MATLLVDAPTPNVSKLEVGSVIGTRYVVQRVLGKGGYGAVFECRHTGTGQGVAVKTLAPGLEADDTALRRFFQEARVTSGLKHPNTIRVFDFGQDDSGLIFLAMELLTGVTLREELKRRLKDGMVFTEEEAIDIGIAVTKSLGEAHAAGLVHRDLKPDNIFLHKVEGDDPVVKVLDFGIVKLADSSFTLGGDSGVPGTPAFMSPEQVQHTRELDGRSDLYSLGVVLFNLVTGVVPFRGRDAMQTLYKHVHEPAPDVRAHAKTPLSDAFVTLIARALAKDPATRPADAREMRSLLLACRPDGGPASVSLPGVPRSRSGEEELINLHLGPNPTPSQRSLSSLNPASSISRSNSQARLLQQDMDFGTPQVTSGALQSRRSSVSLVVFIAVVAVGLGVVVGLIYAKKGPETTGAPIRVEVVQPPPTNEVKTQVAPVPSTTPPVAPVPPAQPAEAAPEPARAVVAPAPTQPAPEVKPQPGDEGSKRKATRRAKNRNGGNEADEVLDTKI